MSSSNHPMPARIQSGFTLVELIVVMAIVAVLIAMLLPAIGMAKEAARDAACKSNMRQQVILANLYSTDYGYYLTRFMTKYDSPLLGTSGSYLPNRYGFPSMILLRNAGYLPVATEGMYTKGLRLQGLRSKSIALCPSGQFLGDNTNGVMGYIVLPRSTDGLDSFTRTQDSYEFNTVDSAIQSYVISASFDRTEVFAGISQPIRLPVKAVPDSKLPSSQLFQAEYAMRDGGDHSYGPSLATLRGTSGYVTEPWPRYVYYRTPHNRYDAGNWSAMDGHVGVVKLRELQAAWSASTTALAAKELPFAY